ncbi:MAG: signal peptidase II [Candidatus Cloacimonadota bacterium]|nr:MAG: signal peptidase II [Candidatus Cloacimonadota bacterium]
MKIFENSIKQDVNFGFAELMIWFKWYSMAFCYCFLAFPFICLRSIPKILKHNKRFVVFWVTLISDFLLKIYFEKNFELGENVEVINGMFSLTLVYNTGAAFGIAKGFSWLFISMALITCAFILVYLALYKEEEPMVSWALVLILSGAIGNMIDRVTVGYVVDYLYVYYHTFNWWPVFNLADIAIDIGVGLIILDIIMDIFGWGKKKEKNLNTL